MSSAGVAPTFHHTDAGTPETVWLGTERWEDARRLDVPAVVDRWTRLVVAAAHPDDESLGAGGLVAELAGAGLPVHVVVATDGERSHPTDGAAGRAGLAALRREEVERALSVLAPRASVEHLGLPDTALEHHEESLRTALARHRAPGTLLLSPWTHDGHADHDALGRASQALGSSPGVDVAYYPIWLWHWAQPQDLPWPHLVVAEPSRASLWRKRSAIAEFRSQVSARGGPEVGAADVAPVLGPAVLARAERVVEALVDPRGVLPVVTPDAEASARALRTTTFDDMYDDGADPWRFEGSFYERRRRAMVLALLARQRYGRVLEIGCAAGHLTAELVERGDEVVALDPSPRAVALAAQRAPSARVVVGAAPGDVPTGPFDLVVLSEVGYFLRPLELLVTLRRCRAALAPGGELLLCHWQHPTTHVPLDGPLVHDQARSMLDLRPAASARDHDLLVEVWRDGPSVAALEGRV